MLIFVTPSFVFSLSFSSDKTPDFLVVDWTSVRAIICWFFGAEFDFWNKVIRFLATTLYFWPLHCIFEGRLKCRTEQRPVILNGETLFSPPFLFVPQKIIQVMHVSAIVVYWSVILWSCKFCPLSCRYSSPETRLTIFIPFDRGYQYLIALVSLAIAMSCISESDNQTFISHFFVTCRITMC